MTRFIRRNLISLAACLVAFTVTALHPGSADAQLSRLRELQSHHSQRRTPSRVEAVLPQVMQVVDAVRDSQRHQPVPPNRPVTPVRPAPAPEPCPVPVPRPEAPPAAGPIAPELTPVQVITAQAKAAFAEGRYERASTLLDEVVTLAPEDTNAYQFRSLAHFARGDVDHAAADAYDAIKLGNAWTWPVLRSLYPEGQASIYTGHLRELEGASKSDEATMATHFLLAYHYIVLGHLENAEQQLNKVLAINAEEQVSRQLLSAVQAAREQQTVSKR